MNFVDVMLTAAFLFFAGSMIGWCTEVLFRRLFTLPLYGFGVAGLFGLSLIPVNTGYAWLDAIIIILIMGVAMTVIEYIAGLIFIKGMKIKLWDYSNRWGNIQGIICPLFSFFWLVVSAFFYFVIDPYLLDAVVWFVNHMAFAFIVGIFFGVFFVDLGHSIQLSAKIRAFAAKHKTVISFEKLKESIKTKIESAGRRKASFIFPFRSNRTLNEELENFTAEQTEQAELTDKADKAVN